MGDHGHVLLAQTVALSLGAACLYGVTSVLQHSAAATVAPERTLRPSLILALLRRPRWLLGNVADLGAYLLQLLALRRGSLLIVQTVLVTGLLFALPCSAALGHLHLRRKEWTGAIAIVVGLALFLAVGLPEGGRGRASGLAWALVFALGCTLVVGLVVTAPRQPGKSRAIHLGAACGVLFGLNAALTKEAAHLLDGGLGHILTSWEPYVLVVLASLGFLLAQSAFHAGPLDASLPLITIANPVVAAAIGVLAFHEAVAAAPLAVVAEVAAVAAMVAGVTILARSPLVAGIAPEPAS
ncbi:MAG: DMT family transporter [Acidimicrobiales bacterium]